MTNHEALLKLVEQATYSLHRNHFQAIWSTHWNAPEPMNVQLARIRVDMAETAALAAGVPKEDIDAAGMRGAESARVITSDLVQANAQPQRVETATSSWVPGPPPTGRTWPPSPEVPETDSFKPWMVVLMIVIAVVVVALVMRYIPSCSMQGPGAPLR